MEQQQFKVSFSVGTKLLIGVVTLLVLVISFLDISTIILLKEDKRAFTYQAQANEAASIGREFVNMVRYALNSLRLAQAGVESSQGVHTQDPAALRRVLESQHEVFALTLVHVDFRTGRSELIAQASRGKELSKLGYDSSDLIYPEKLIRRILLDLRKSGVAFLNLSKSGKPPLLGLAYLDTSRPDAKGAVMALGYISLEAFGAETRASSITLATKRGETLFDSDPARMFGDRVITSDPLFLAALDAKLTTGAQEYEHEGVHYLGSYFRPGFDLIVMSKTEWRKAMRATYALAEKFILLGFMSIGAAILFAILFAKSITAPLAQLYQATRQVAAGNFNIRLTTRSRDELGALSGSFVAMSAKINDLIQESIRSAHLENELAIASTVQQTLFPPNGHKTPRVSIYSHYQSATECGGDWWGFFEVGDRLAVMIADATGHGLPSALITAAARSCYSVMHKLALEDPKFAYSPGRMLSYANRVVNDAASGQINMTFFNGVIDFESGRLTYASAGHNPPWLFRKAGGVVSLTADGQRLGESKEVPPYEEKTIEIASGDTLFLYTDGVIEGKNLEGTQYGKKRMRKLIDSVVDDGPEKVIKTLMADFLQHNGQKELDDDVTLATFRILKTGK